MKPLYPTAVRPARWEASGGVNEQVDPGVISRMWTIAAPLTRLELDDLMYEGLWESNYEE